MRISIGRRTVADVGTAAGRALLGSLQYQASMLPDDRVPALVAAIEAEARAAALAGLQRARREMENRYRDLLWCNKDDDCRTKAEGARLAIEDFEDIMGLEPLDHPQPDKP